MTSLAHRIAQLPFEKRAALFEGLDPESLDVVSNSWEIWARPEQLAPKVPFRTWLFLGGRGVGKTRSAAEWCRAEIEGGRRVQMGIVGPTADAIRRVQVEGPSGIMAVSPPNFRPSYEPSTRRVTYPNGAIIHLVSAEEPDRIRGLNLDGYWWDEITSCENAPQVWDMLQMALRVTGPLGHSPCGIITTTPKPQPLLKSIMASSTTVITKGRTMDNQANLDASTLKYLQDKYGGTTIGRQELDAELLEDAEGALWTRNLIDRGRVYSPPDLKRIVVALDPAGGSGEGNDETGIVIAGLGHDDHCYLLSDLSGKYTPERWARRAIDAFRMHRADRIVCEQNFGGAMIESTLRAVDLTVPIKMVHASRGKVIRAEPVVALYEQSRVHHVGNYPELEDQLCQWEPHAGMGSPDRLDALVWAITDLALGVQARPAQWTNIDWMSR